jgi:AmmeMemoRadiSam system protein B
MPQLLAPLRRGLDAMPSPVEDRPGLLLRDPFRYAEGAVIVPPPLVPFLRYFDGAHDEGDLAAALYRATGELGSSAFARRLAESLGRGGFLEDEELARRQEARHGAFAAASRREPSSAGSAYPKEAAELGRFLRAGLEAGDGDDSPPPPGVFAIAAPHVSFEGGFGSYASAYRALSADASERTFVVLGTSHYGAPERFGLTRKPYATPLGETTPDVAVVDRLAAAGGEAAVVEDYCHAVEHSVEFQVVVLQHLFGPAVRVVPVLCGPFAKATTGPGRPEDDPGVARVLGALAELHAREGRRLLWVLGVDMAHVGRRYGGDFAAEAGRGPLVEVGERDRRRIDALVRGDADGFWAQVQEGEDDDLNWCGAAPLYAFLRATRPRAGALLRYEQWNIDPASVVSFAALAFGDRAAAPAGEGGA